MEHEASNNNKTLEDDDWNHLPPLEQLLKDHATSSQDEKHDELLKELEILKKMMTDMSLIILKQNETIDKSIDNSVESSKQLADLSEQLNKISSQLQPSRWRYVKDYIVPLCGLLGVNTPFMVLLGIKTGFISVPCSYLIYQIGKYMV